MNIEDEEAEVAAFHRALEEGLALFNEQKFFEAYEVWSVRWQEETTEGADLLQGLLQVAVGFAKLSDGNPRATVKLLTTAVDKLMMYAPADYGIDIDGLVATVREWRRTAEEIVERGTTEGVTFPAVTVTKR